MADINVIVLPDGTEYPVSDYYIPVSISNPTNGQVLKYDAANNVWYNGDDVSGSSVLYGTSAPTSQLGTDGCLYVKYTEGTGGASDTVDALYVKLDGNWCQISTGGGGGASSADQVSVDDTNLAYEADDVQEALEKITKTLTWAEYQALSDAEKNNGTIYNISDVNGNGQDFQPVIYSEDEREIGVWTDGKPLYRKTITGVMSSNLNVDRIFYFCEIDVSALSIDTGFFDTEGSYYTVNGIKISFVKGSVNGSTLEVWTHYQRDNVPYVITLIYTKSTDTAGSGTWTPQGVPAVHYSTDEKVVGTWIDGKPLYEKTIPTNTAFGNNWTKLTEIDNIDCIVETTVVVNEGGNRSYGVRQGYFCEISTITGEEGFVMLYNSTGFNVTVKYVTIRYTKSS